jgi:hypothetical protein
MRQQCPLCRDRRCRYAHFHGLVLHVATCHLLIKSNGWRGDSVRCFCGEDYYVIRAREGLCSNGPIKLIPNLGLHLQDNGGVLEHYAACRLGVTA